MAKSVRRVFPPAPTSARAVVLRAHPLASSFNSALADAWVHGARDGGAEVHVLDVHDLAFDPVLRLAHTGEQPLEEDLLRVQAEIAAAAHVTVAYPVWWGSLPAKLKGLFDRAFQPGWAYAAGDGVLPDKGLSGRTGRILVTMDAFGWYDRLVYGASARRQVRNATFHFTGIKPTRVSTFGGIETSTPASRATMLQRAQAAGVEDGKALVNRFGAPVQARATRDVICEAPPGPAGEGLRSSGGPPARVYANR
ncbi:MAG: NAD(P)H-dependent oxidoreductase [Deltaproteobacteria bacterium]|nr:NAD(P)H-dependent oxidoreductase [Deltaproteobacteria bacterium]